MAVNSDDDNPSAENRRCATQPGITVHLTPVHAAGLCSTSMHNPPTHLVLGKELTRPSKTLGGGGGGGGGGVTGAFPMSTVSRT